MQNKRDLVLWSGGFDSTLVLFELVHEKINYILQNQPSEEIRIDVLSFQINSNSSLQDKHARTILKVRLQDEIYKLASSDGRYVVNMSDGDYLRICIGKSAVVINFIEEDFTLTRFNATTQSLAWANLLGLYVHEGNHTKIHLGYIKTDEFWHIQTPFRRAIENVEEYYAELCYDSPTKIEIAIPFKWMTKLEMVDRYLKFDCNVFAAISWAGDYDGQKDDDAQRCVEKFNAINVKQEEVAPKEEKS